MTITTVDICVCTYRRKHLADTLRSLANLILPRGVKPRILVADNDINQSAQKAVLSEAGRSPVPIEYIHAPGRNISVARNACLDHAKADWIAFIDDDESVSSRWLASLLDAANEADVVFGPVTAIYGSTTPKWIKRGDFHSTRIVFNRGQIRTGYAGNVMIRRSAIEVAGLRFDLVAGATGGEDTQFFGRLFDLGFKLAYAPRALAWEEVPEQRQTLGWLVRRSFRSGRSYAILLRERGGMPLVVHFMMAAGKTGVCLLNALANSWSQFGWRKWFIRCAMHAGVTLQLAGL